MGAGAYPAARTNRPPELTSGITGAMAELKKLPSRPLRRCGRPSECGPPYGVSRPALRGLGRMACRLSESAESFAANGVQSSALNRYARLGLPQPSGKTSAVQYLSG